MNGKRAVTVPAPAKINLGLEILCKRDDGYHEIRTILSAIGLSDTLTVTMIPDREETFITGVDGVAPEDNIIRKAIDAFSGATGIQYGYDVVVNKRIPSPGGLGGASSNAASTLKALNAMHGTPLSTDRLMSLAATLGSDVPFFTGPPVALASGTGTTLDPLAPIDGHIVLVAPRVDLTAKTARLYRAIEPIDYSDGRRVEHAARLIREGHLPYPDLLHNAFSRPLYELIPGLRDLAGTIASAGAPHVALSGAGPAHYVLFRDRASARRLADTLRTRISPDVLVVILPIHAKPVPGDLAER